MIKVNGGDIEMEGTERELLADLATLVHAFLYKTTSLGKKKDVAKYIAIGFLDDKEVAALSKHVWEKVTEDEDEQS